MSTMMAPRIPARHSIVAQVPVVVYGNRWCGITQIVRRYLERRGVPYRYVDLDRDPEAERRLRWLAGGAVRNPVVYVNGDWLEQPSMDQLGWVLARHGL